MESEQIGLLKHPLVTSLIDKKLNNFGWYFYFTSLLLYLVFLIFLTSFALVVLNPQTDTCESTLNSNLTSYLTKSLKIIFCFLFVKVSKYSMVEGVPIAHLMMDCVLMEHFVAKLIVVCDVPTVLLCTPTYAQLVHTVCFRKITFLSNPLVLYAVPVCK